jgi:hypothetical protein
MKEKPGSTKHAKTPRREARTGDGKKKDTEPPLRHTGEARVDNPIGPLVAQALHGLSDEAHTCSPMESQQVRDILKEQPRNCPLFRQSEDLHYET